MSRLDTPLYSSLHLFHTPDAYLFSSSSGVSGRFLVVDRVTGDVSIADGLSVPIDRVTKTEELHGIVGIVELVSGPHLVVVKRRRKLGDLTHSNHPVYELAEADVLPYCRTVNHLTRGQQQENESFLAMMNQVLATPSFYFSYTTDLTRSMQSKEGFAASSSPESESALEQVTRLYSDWEERFVWNRFLLEPFLSRGAEFLRYCLPLIHGCVFIRQCSINGRLFRWSLVSRRSRRRAGTRYFSRGCDSDGECSNFVETEQIVEHADSCSSFILTRGSIPLSWSQLPNVINYKPECKIGHEKSHAEGFSKHFSQHITKYGACVIVNLIDQNKKAEGNLERQYRSQHSTAGIRGVEYVAFDFHSMCANLKWDRLSLLIKDLQPYQSSYSYFMKTTNGGIISRQLGTFRVNCMDSLDRTNVVQSLLSSENLQDVLVRVGVLREGQAIGDQTEFQRTFRNIWADHADALSVQYAGTPALKTDFTRTGKRTVAGVASDIQNSAVRYYKNNFSDGFRQDAIDLFLGNYVVKSGEGVSTPYADTSLRWIAHLPLVFVICVAMTFLTLVLSGEVDHGIFFLLLFWFSASIGVGAMIYRNAADLVDFPKLKKLA